MKSIAEPLTKLVDNCMNLALHTSMNRVCEFAVTEAPNMIKDIEALEQENERLKQRVAELEQQLNPDTARADSVESEN